MSFSGVVHRHKYGDCSAPEARPTCQSIVVLEHCMSDSLYSRPLNDGDAQAAFHATQANFVT